MQEALLPTALPVLPQVRVAAHYLVAGHQQAAGGDWFDAISLPGGSVALIVGDVSRARGSGLSRNGPVAGRAGRAARRRK